MKQNVVCHCTTGSSDKVYITSIRTASDGTYTVIGKWGRNGAANLQSQVKGTFRTEAQAVAEQIHLHTERINKKGYVDIESPAYEGSLTMATPFIVKNLEDTSDDERGRGLLDIEKGQRYTIKSSNKRKRYLNGPTTVELESGEEAIKVLCECGHDKFEAVASPDAKRLYRCLQCGKVRTPGGNEVAADPPEDEGVVICTDNKGIEDKFDEGIEYVSEDNPSEEFLYVYDKFGEKQECFRSRFEKKSIFVRLEDA